MVCVVSEVKLSPPEVDRMVELLQQYSGEEEDRHVLDDIAWMSRRSQWLSNSAL